MSPGSATPRAPARAQVPPRRDHRGMRHREPRRAHRRAGSRTPRGPPRRIRRVGRPSRRGTRRSPPSPVEPRPQQSDPRADPGGNRRRRCQGARAPPAPARDRPGQDVGAPVARRHGTRRTGHGRERLRGARRDRRAPVRRSWRAASRKACDTLRTGPPRPAARAGLHDRPGGRRCRIRRWAAGRHATCRAPRRRLPPRPRDMPSMPPCGASPRADSACRHAGPPEASRAKSRSDHGTPSSRPVVRRASPRRHARRRGSLRTSRIPGCTAVPMRGRDSLRSAPTRGGPGAGSGSARDRTPLSGSPQSPSSGGSRHNRHRGGPGAGPGDRRRR